MSSKDVWRAIEIYSSVYQRFTNFPLMYAGNKRVVQITSVIKLKYYILSFPILIFSLAPSVVVVFGSWLQLDYAYDVPLWKVLVFIGAVFLGTFALAVMIFFPLNGALMPPLLESVQKLERDLEQETSKRRGKKKKKRKPDYIFILLGYGVYVCLWIAISAPVFNMIIGIEPYNILANYLFPTMFTKFHSWLVFFIFRYILYSIAFFEVGRAVLMVSWFAVYACRLAMRYVELVKKVKDPKSFIHLYNQIQLILTVVHKVIEFVAAVASVALLVSGIAGNFGTIKGYSIVPVFVYWYFPICAVSAVIMIYTTIPVAIQFYENTLELLETKPLDYTDRLDFKILSRKLKAIRPLMVHAGLMDFRLFYFERSTMVTFYEVYEEYTLTALLSIELGEY